MAKRKKKSKRIDKRAGLNYEEERWTLHEDAPLFGKGWTRRLEYSFTDFGTRSRFTLYNAEGKKFSYPWQKSAMTREMITERAEREKIKIKVTKRRKPKEVSF